MSKRRISQQQLARIQNKQKVLQSASDEHLHDGLVIARYSQHVLVEDADRNITKCAIRTHIDSLTAGDRVVWQSDHGRRGVIVSRYPRQTVLGRPDDRGHLKAIAANVTQILVMVAPVPVISWVLLDRYLVMAEHLGVSVCIVLNKTDLVCDELIDTLQREYVSLGYSLLLTGQQDPDSSALYTQLHDQVSVCVGQSGVGKSSFIARILPHEAEHLPTQAISVVSQLGCHTTRNARFYHLPAGGALIDSPGVRDFSLWQMSKADIAYGYREFREYIGHCKFRNCDHQATPGCAVLEALKNSLISTHRYENYVKMTTS